MIRTLKIRRVGNSNVVSIPRELADRGFNEGATVIVEELANGDVRISPESKRSRVREIGQRVINERRKALDILAERERAEAVHESIDG